MLAYNRRGLPRRGEAHGRPRRPLTGVRARAPERLWKQLVASPSDTASQAAARTDAVVAFCLAAAAAVAVKVPALFGMDMDEDADFYARNLSFFVLPLLTATSCGSGTVNLHRPLARARVRRCCRVRQRLSVRPGQLHRGPDGPPSPDRAVAGRGDRVRRWPLKPRGRPHGLHPVLGELLIYYVLIALGGGVLTAFMVAMFESIGIDPEPFIESWLLPCGAAGAVVVAAWLVEAKQSVIENMAPVLTRLFTPLFAAVLVTFLGALLWTETGVDFDRDLLITFNLLLVVVLGLLLYSLSARNPARLEPPSTRCRSCWSSRPCWSTRWRLWTIGGRITEFGFSPIRVAALGANVILLVNLAWSAALYIRFLRGRGSVTALDRWQTNYLPVYAVWAAIVVVVFPPLFGYA